MKIQTPFQYDQVLQEIEILTMQENKTQSEWERLRELKLAVDIYNKENLGDENTGN